MAVYVPRSLIRLQVHITSFGLACSEKAGSQDVCAAEVWHDALLAVMADGVGAARAGREAATKTVESVVANFKSRPRTWSMHKALDEFTRLINRTLHQESLARFERLEMLATLSVVTVEGGKLVGLNVGDSRAYLLHDGQLTQLTTDHAEDGPEVQHVLTRAIGMAADVSPYHVEREVVAGDMLLLCTDGVSNVLPAGELQVLLQRRASARTIVATAREQATEENLDDATAIVVEIVELDPHKGDGQALEIPDTLAAGQTHDGYTLVRPFNQTERTWITTRAGAQAVVKFAPRDARHNEAILNQFVKEIWSVTRLKADFFIRAFVPENNRVLCYVMEYIEAPTLKEVVRPGPLAIDDTIALARFLLDASQFLLGFDLVHGDLKPENILVLQQGGAVSFKLIDFGSISEIFSVTSRAGTPSYLAPERFHAAPLTERTEIFALGVVLHEALTRAFPYGEIEPFQTPAFLAPKNPSRLNPNMPPWLESVLLRALAVKPEERYQNYSEMKFDLENPAQVKPWFRRSAPLLERNPLLFYKTGFFILLALTLYLGLRLALK